MRGRTCLITGGTSGVGGAIAAGLAELGAEVIITCRDNDRGRYAVEELIKKSGNKDISCMFVDLSEQASIRDFADRFSGTHQSLHVLSNNAATFPMHRKVTRDGIESIWATNYLSHFLLTHLLMGLLKKSAPSRIITVSGNPNILRKGRINFDDPQFSDRFSPFKATLQAAFAKVVFSLELAKKLENTGVTSNTFHPGLVRSRLAREFPALLKPATIILEGFLRSSCTSGVFAAASPEADGISGKFFKGTRPLPFLSPGYTEETGARLWDLSRELTGV